MASTATLTFDDEFNTLSLWNGTSGTWDTTGSNNTWNGSGFSLTGNGEQEWYINSNYAPTSSVTPWTDNNGILTLTAAPAPAFIQPLINGYQYTSGAINTSQSFSQTYGFFEMRAQLPAGQGLWPAFWMVNENNQWPPEIDIMEMLGNNPGVYYTSAHSGTASNEINAGQADSVADTSAGYHTYAVDWEPDFLTYYFDGQVVYRTATPSQMDTPMYLIANLAVGGGWPGNVDSSTPMPAQMNIDFIRAYSSLPSWIADGSDPTDVNHTPAGSVGNGTGSTGTGSTGTAGSSASTPYFDAVATFTMPAGMTNVVLTGSAAQTITGNNLGDTITSNNSGSTIIGGTGNDKIIAGFGHDMITGGGGNDTFVFPGLPWNSGHITDFNPATDKIDLSGILSSVGYTGTNPVADGYVSFVSDGVGDTLVYVDPHNPAQPWATLITTLDHVSPSSVSVAILGSQATGSGSSGTGSTGTGSTGTGSTGTGSTGTGSTGTGSTGTSSTGTTGSAPANDSAATFTVPAGVTNVVLTGSAAQTITANNLGDTITSNNFGSTIIGGTGNDTLIAGYGHDMFTGGGGNDTFVFNYLPWNAGHITDFNTLTDKIDLTGIFQSIGYTGSNPVADGYLSFVSDGAGNTLVYVDAHNPSAPWATLIATIDHMTPGSILPANWTISASVGTGSTGTGSTGTGSTGTGSTGTGSTGTGSTGTGSTGTGSTGTGSTGTSSTPTNDSASTYTVPAGITNVVLTGTAAQTITANNLGDTITSNDYGSTIVGGTGNDTLIAGHGHDTLTGGAGSDFFVFNFAPWNAGHITDFTPGTDKIDLSGALSLYGYTGTNPIADGWLSLTSDGGGDTLVYLNTHDPNNPWPFLMTTVDHVAPTSLSLADFGYGSTSSGGATTGGSTSGGTTTTGPTTETAATYTVPTGVTNVILGGTAPQTITANNAGDTITSNNFGSTIIGGTGNDTFIAGTGADHLTGGAGSDTFVFNSLPTQAGHITDFNTAQDVLDLSGIFSSIGYTGTNPLKNSWLSFVSDHHGDTNVYVNPHNGTGSHLLTTLDHVLPSSITTSDWIWHH